MGEHALLSASAASRWLVCTMAPRYEAQFPDKQTSYTQEGTLAHSLCELEVNHQVANAVSDDEYKAKLAEIKGSELFQPEMLTTASTYVDHIWYSAIADFEYPPYIVTEVRVEFDDIVPEGFGTCDCIMIGDDLISITDYKHGKGVPVEAYDNPQMKLYAWGALRKYRSLYGDSIKRVRMAIVQPRLAEEASTAELTVEELERWTEEVKPIATKAYYGFGEYVPGKHCGFCRGKIHCPARSEQYLRLKPLAESGDLKLKTVEEIGELLKQAEGLQTWYRNLKDHVESLLMSGQAVPGWKLVAGKSNRKFTNQDQAFKHLIDTGIPDAMLFERKPRTLSEIEKMLGKKDFATRMADYVIKPQGSPTLAPETDGRPEYVSSAEDDFKDINK